MIEILFENLINSGRGFCINSESLEDTPDHGYLVDLDDTEFLLGYDEHQEVKAKLWVVSMAQDFNDRLYLCGHYNSEDGAMMSACVHCLTREEAVNFAKENNQTAIWNCYNNEIDIINHEY
jgi:hypothetical protein